MVKHIRMRNAIYSNFVTDEIWKIIISNNRKIHRSRTRTTSCSRNWTSLSFSRPLPSTLSPCWRRTTDDSPRGRNFRWANDLSSNRFGEFMRIGSWKKWKSKFTGPSGQPQLPSEQQRQAVIYSNYRLIFSNLNLIPILWKRFAMYCIYSDDVCNNKQLLIRE